MNPSIVFDMDQDDDQVSEDSTDSVLPQVSRIRFFVKNNVQRTTHIQI